MLQCFNWAISGPNEVVPGTSILWARLVEESVVFPVNGSCLAFPFAFMPKMDDQNRSKYHTAIQWAEAQIPGLKFDSLMPEFTQWLAFSNEQQSYQGQVFEQLFVHSLAVCYYLKKKVLGDGVVITLRHIYFDPDSESLFSKNFANLNIDLSGGIITSDKEALVQDPEISNNSIYLNQKIRTAHHDAIIVSNGLRIAISFKSSFSAPDGSVVAPQLQYKVNTSATSGRCNFKLLWAYVKEDSSTTSKNYRVETVTDAIKSARFAFATGDGCISPVAIRSLRIMKGLKSTLT